MKKRFKIDRNSDGYTIIIDTKNYNNIIIQFGSINPLTKQSWELLIAQTVCELLNTDTDYLPEYFDE